MVRFKTAGALLFISLFIVLPLYELADAGEHWPHDGLYVSMVLSVLFLIGFTLVLRKLVSLAARDAVASQAANSGHLDRHRTLEAFCRSVENSSRLRVDRTRAWARLKFPVAPTPGLDRTSSPLFVILSDFRI